MKKIKFPLPRVIASTIVSLPRPMIAEITFSGETCIRRSCCRLLLNEHKQNLLVTEKTPFHSPVDRLGCHIEGSYCTISSVPTGWLRRYLCKNTVLYSYCTCRSTWGRNRDLARETET